MKATRYMVTVGELQVPIEADAERGIVLAPSGRSADIVRVNADTWSVISAGSAYTIRVRRTTGAMTMCGRGPEIAVAVDSERSRLLKLAGTSAAKAEHGTSIVAPMPALVVRLEVEAGQEVVAGQGLVVLEAMKMENEIRAPRTGKIAVLRARVGSPVEKGEVLIILE